MMRSGSSSSTAEMVAAPLPTRLHLEAGEAETGGEQVADVGLVVDDQDARISHDPIMVTSAMRC